MSLDLIEGVVRQSAERVGGEKGLYFGVFWHD
jgi:hypothetical protein